MAKKESKGLLGFNPSKFGPTKNAEKLAHKFGGHKK